MSRRILLAHQPDASVAIGSSFDDTLPSSLLSAQWTSTTGISKTGNGLGQTIDMYGEIPTQAAPGGGWPNVTYTDTVTMTVTY